VQGGGVGSLVSGHGGAAGNEMSYIDQTIGRGGRMRARCRRNAVIGGLLLLSSLLFAGWMPLTSGVTTALNAVQFPVSTLVGYAVGNGGVILKTTDGGGTWTPQTSGVTDPLMSVSFANDSTGFVVGAAGTALKTTDGGSTWTPMSVGTTGMLFQVQLVGTNGTAYLVYDDRGTASVRKTTDWGGSWQNQTLPGMNHPVRCLYFTSEEVGFAAGSFGYIVRTTDGGGSYIPLGTGVGGKDYLALAFRPGDPSVGYMGGNDTNPSSNTIFETTNSGDTWLTLEPPYVQSWNALACPDGPAGAFAAGTGGMIAKYSTHGWVVQATGVTSAINGLSFPVDGWTGYAVGADGVILKTTDGGGPGVEEGKEPAVSRTGIRVVSNPCRHGIVLHSDTDVNVVVFDAAGRAVMSRAAAKGANLLPLGAGAYFVKAGAQTARAVVTD